ncbi:DEAD/DEAH box helicase family protein [Deferribacterales bacterium RsTz2092]
MNSIHSNSTAHKKFNSFDNVLVHFRDISLSERDKGTRFELLIKGFLKTYRVYEGMFKDIWLWDEFPYRGSISNVDTGIDLVALTFDGDYWAIQCKCYDEKTEITKAAVDSFISASGKEFTDDNGVKVRFAQRFWISTTNKFSSHADEAIAGQQPAFIRLSLRELQDANVDWQVLLEGKSGVVARLPKKGTRPHQRTAIDNAHKYFANIANATGAGKRGKLIMACGTGKTFTSLKIAEKELPNGGFVLFLVPSIALLGQTLREWKVDAELAIKAICVCSDATVSKKKFSDEDTGFKLEDLAYPANTDAASVAKQLKEAKKAVGKEMTVVFSTYHSIGVVSEAQKQADLTFDLIICDEAHRTTGHKQEGDDSHAFVMVHDNAIIKGHKRLYMTATPRIYGEGAQKQAEEKNLVLYSMDDEKLFGKEIYRLGFGEAVDNGLLSDYKVLVFSVNEKDLPATLRSELVAGSDGAIATDDIDKLGGCVRALSKKITTNILIDDKQTDDDSNEFNKPMRKAVAFCQNIKTSRAIQNSFNKINEYFKKEIRGNNELVNVHATHIDGGMNASERDSELDWLREEQDDECRVVCNVRCLSEGVDVPSLDAVLFLSAKNSPIEVVQSVGRVMRKAEGKKYGYIIIPVVFPSDTTPEDALNEDSNRYRVVWTVLNALRAHDDRFDSIVNMLSLGKRDGHITVGGTDTTLVDTTLDPDEVTDKWKFADYLTARIVEKVGNKRYWEDWAKDVAKIADNYKVRINELLAGQGQHRAAFEKFLENMRTAINPSLTEAGLVEMLAQHLISKPVFEALFEDYAFVKNNPVSKSLQKMIERLEGADVNKDNEDNIKLTRFYESVKQRVAGLTSAEDRQKVIIELYDKFFKVAMPKIQDKLGIVYTPVEVVDFINSSVAKVLERDFGRTLSDEQVHILDPFTGTGTFIARLIQTGLIDKDALKRKYQQELHANELVLLAYYIATINIENAFHATMWGAGSDDRSADNNAGYAGYAGMRYIPFEGICWTDTFQMGETYEKHETNEENSERITKQQKAPINVIIGNPPYSVGQKSANDDTKNQKYPKLDSRITETYAKSGTASNKNKLSDSYIKAFRWATDRLVTNGSGGGVIAFITNSGWIDGTSMDGFRKCLTEDFNAIYIFNLRGGIRGKSGDTAKREGENVFDIMAGVAIVVLVRGGQAGESKGCAIHYKQMDDYLKKADKLKLLKELNDITSADIAWQEITPNKEGDWLNQRNDLFQTFIPLGDKKNKKTGEQSFFEPIYSLGLNTNRDAWCYNFSRAELIKNMQKTIGFYSEQLADYKTQKGKVADVEKFITKDATKLALPSSTVAKFARGESITFSEDNIVLASYRPFNKQWCYFHRDMNHRTGQMPKLFPTPEHKNVVICIVGTGTPKDFSTIITDALPDLEIQGHSQCFPLYYYIEHTNNDGTSVIGQYDRLDGITDYILTEAQGLYGKSVKKEDIFYYVYGLLHSRDYIKQFSADLKKVLARLPLLKSVEDFWVFSKAGRELAGLHLNYEQADKYPAVKVEIKEGKTTDKLDLYSLYRIGKMSFPNKEDKSVIKYNENITITGIPLVAYEYVLNGRSAIEWLIDRWQVSTDKPTGITNDPNLWLAEQNNPSYIVDLLLAVITISVKTVGIVNRLPKVEFGVGKG